mmetsp:Transcript_22322/g.73375  ORF Transcript_22322/g.73375 Transcript_22322/m.73375 type:complete len:217 (-) Transcript_22322:1413-2063(-)
MIDWVSCTSYFCEASHDAVLRRVWILDSQSLTSLSTSRSKFSMSEMCSCLRLPTKSSIVRFVKFALIFSSSTLTRCPPTSLYLGCRMTSKYDSGGYKISFSSGYWDRNSRLAPRSIAPQPISNTIGSPSSPAYWMAVLMSVVVLSSPYSTPPDTPYSSSRKKLSGSLSPFSPLRTCLLPMRDVWRDSLTSPLTMQWIVVVYMLTAALGARRAKLYL